MAVLIFIGILLASLAGNAWQWHANGVEHDARTAAETKFSEQRDATKACNDSIASLTDAANERARNAEKARTAAQLGRQAAERKAQKILSTPAAFPGDDCGSAKKRVQDWLGERKP